MFLMKNILIRHAVLGVLLGFCAAVNADVEMLGIWTDKNYKHIALYKQHAYIADESNGLAVFNVRDPANPQAVFTYSLPSKATAITVGGNYLYLAGDTLVYVFALHTPASPRFVDTLPAGGNALGLQVSGNYLYIAANSGDLRILDISVLAADQNPAIDSLAGTNGYTVRSPGSHTDIAVNGDYAYLVSHLGGLSVINIKDIEQPFTGVSLHENYPRVVGGYAPDDGALPKRVSVSDGYLFMSGVGGSGNSPVHILDLSDPKFPVLAGKYATGGSAEYMAVSGGYVYVADKEDNLLVIDANVPSKPLLLKTFNTPGLFRDLAGDNGILYIADGGGRLSLLSAPQAFLGQGINPQSGALTAGVKFKGGIQDSAGGIQRMLSVQGGIDSFMIQMHVETAPAHQGKPAEFFVVTVYRDGSGAELLFNRPAGGPDDMLNPDNPWTLFTGTDSLVPIYNPEALAAQQQINVLNASPMLELPGQLDFYLLYRPAGGDLVMNPIPLSLTVK